MKHTQVLASGLMIRQDIGEAVRAIFFQTDFEEWLYATYGGTAFVVRYLGRIYGLTCSHVFQDFPHGNLFITAEKIGQKGSNPAPIKGLFLPSSPTKQAVETDITDLCVIEFSDDISSDFFKGTEYVIDDRTWTTARKGHSLRVHGVLKEKSYINPPDIAMGFCNLEFADNGSYTSDPFLRHGIARYDRPAFNSITGISGAPVFDETANALCGMVARGGMNSSDCSIYYFDISDMIRVLDAANKGALTHIHYQKFVASSDLPLRRD